MTTTARCPTCRAVSHKDGNKLFPFCSERCHLVDLGRWLNEDYRIPDQPDTSGGGADSAVPQKPDES
ncbi:MAG: DNA gyrase inhibitor YacG [Deltaproteobacteria bacterium]|nr:DNA gyrase inhibitor YacG [Deltaproteobacteria bacterium]